MLGWGPKVVNAGLRSNAGLKPKSGAELDAVNAGAEPDAGPDPNAVNAGPKPDAVNTGLEPDAVERPSGHGSSCRGGKVKAASGLPAKVGTTRLSWVAGMDSASGHSTSGYGEVKTAGGLPAKVGTTRLSCGVGGRAGRPLVIASLAMER
ncbi:hypothetical protein CDL15_Pgr001046 [Punica granatum]|uniref:Uncharacterized protein n=1 Tax=Punica granatum TaxID=22663 RepID=A0A218WZK6_PUNGR|nr:hypothetical protein CDL15_Pgr001046 [Punica granatum]